MTKLFVTCAGYASTRFDRNYYVNTHLPLTMEAWEPYGLEAAAAFFPADDGNGIISVGVYDFRDEAAINAALASPQTERVMVDVKHFTDATVIERSILTPMGEHKNNNLTALLVTYAGDTGTRFDRDYYVSTHLPLVLEAWVPYGLETAAAFFPDGDGAGTIAVCICGFRDAAAIDAAIASPQTERVMADVKNFTDAEPLQSRAVSL